MGCEQEIIIAWGYRIPEKEWEAFVQQLKERPPAREALEAGAPSLLPELCAIIAEYVDFAAETEKLIERMTDSPGFFDGSDSYRFVYQSKCSHDDEVYAFIFDTHKDCITMDRTVGGSCLWMYKEFEHMQNIPTLSFSVQLDYNTDVVPRDDDDHIKSMMKDMPQELSDWLASLSDRKYFNKWLYSHAH